MKIIGKENHPKCFYPIFAKPEKMEQFVVSARKYRPSTFDTVVGQDSITGTLKNAIRNHHMAQGFLFCGPRGVGKTTCARILAKTMNCENLTESTEPCNQCESCESFNHGNSLNIYELDAASNNSVDDIRALTEQVRFAPHRGRYKIYIIDEVHMLTLQAFNAFLKTLEEPPPYAIFILATTEKHKIIPTILSRCQIYDFQRITINDIALHLEKVSKGESVEAEPEALHLIARKADGALRDALSIFDQIVSYAGNKLTYQDVVANLNILDSDFYFRISDEIAAKNVAEAILIFHEILEKGFDGHHFITGLATHFRNLLMCQNPKTVSLLEVGKEEKEKYNKQALAFQPAQLFHYLDLSAQCGQSYKGYKNPNLLVEISLMKMCSIPGLSQAPVPEPEKKKDERTPIPTGIKQPQPAIPPPQKTPFLKTDASPVQGLNRSFFSIRGEQPKPPVPKTSDAAPTADSVSVSKTLDEESVNLGIKKLLEDLSAGHLMTLHTNLVNGKWKFLGENKIHFFDLTKSLKDVEKNEIADRLKRILEVNPVVLTFEMKPTIVQSPEPYTNLEKFKILVQKNPALQDMKNIFDLDVNI